MADIPRIVGWSRSPPSVPEAERATQLSTDPGGVLVESNPSDPGARTSSRSSALSPMFHVKQLNTLEAAEPRSRLGPTRGLGRSEERAFARDADSSWETIRRLRGLAQHLE